MSIWCINPKKKSIIQNVMLIAFSTCIVMSCVLPRRASPEWIIKRYSIALLTSKTEFMRRYVATGLQVEEASRNPYVASLHVIRICYQIASKEGDKRNVLVLFGGRMDGLVYGIDMILIKEYVGWRVRRADLSKTATGKPMIYLRNCQVDRSSESKSLNSDLTSPFPIPDLQGGEIGF